MNQRATVDFTMQLGAVTETVDVKAAAPLLEAGTSSVGQVIESKAVAKELFGRVVELEPDLRASILDAACAGRRQLRREVESLLVAYQGPERQDFLDAREALRHAQGDGHGPPRKRK